MNGDAAIGELVNTRDLGLFDGYIYLAGRSADRLRVDGENFGAAQVERVPAELPATASNKILKRRLVKDGWRLGGWRGVATGAEHDDPVWWRPGRDLAYRRMTAEDAAGLRAEFERRGRQHLLEGSG